ncbi:MAG: hypothetical protein Q4F69_00190 [Bacteroidia bacterium]|nr:hypothetical protein [Bacteroidia bacterium]
MEDVDIKCFTANDLKRWLFHNQSIDGLTDEVIAPARAFAIVNNPYLRDDDAVVAALYVDDDLVAYTAAFPEFYDGKRIWWFSTLYCKPEYSGRGYGLIVVGSLAEIYGDGNFFDMEGAEETVEIFKYLGLNTSYSIQYNFCPGKIDRTSFWGNLAYYIQQVRLKLKCRKNILMQKLSAFEYKVEYSRHVDDESYSFILENRKNDAFVREQKMLNWIVQYPFLQGSPLTNRVDDRCRFSSVVPSVTMLVVKVVVKDELAGLYILRFLNNGFSVKYLYYNDDRADVVFTSVAEHLVAYNNPTVSTRDEKLALFLKQYNLSSKLKTSRVSFSYPSEFVLVDDFTLQGGDGDNFV